jgi:hypothetical protein
MIENNKGLINKFESPKDTSMKHLKKMSFDYKRNKYPSVPILDIPKTNYKDKTANGLTKCIKDFLNLSGWQAERINNTGRMVDGRTAFTDVLGRCRTVGSVGWVKGTGTDGTADISATIKGMSVKIEIKIGSDRQSEAQRNYQHIIEKAGGIYFIAKDFAQFYSWYLKTFTP